MTIHTLGPFNPSDSNVYLLTGKRNILVDTGLGLDHDMLVSSIKSLIPNGNLDMIILTHCHVDHIGGLHGILKEFGCNAVALEPDAEHIRKADSYTLSTFFGLDLEQVPVESLSDGDVIDIEDHRLRVIHTPGHTEGGICLYDEITLSLITGDTLFVNGIGRTDFPSGSISKLRSSLSSLDKIDFIGLYPGHGEVSRFNGKQYLSIGRRMLGD